MSLGKFNPLLYIIGLVQNYCSSFTNVKELQ